MSSSDGYLEKIVEVRVPDFPYSFSPEYPNIHSVVLRESISYCISKLLDSEIPIEEVLKHLSVCIPTVKSPVLILKIDRCPLNNPLELAKEFYKLQNINQYESFPVKDNLAYMFRTLVEIGYTEIKLTKNGYVHSLGIINKKQQKRSELWLKTIEQTDKEDGLEIKVSLLSSQRGVESILSAWIKLTRNWRINPALNVSGSWTKALEEGRNLKLKSYGFEIDNLKSIRFIDTRTEAEALCGLIAYKYEYLCFERKKDFPYLYIGEHLNCQVLLNLEDSFTSYGSRLEESRRIYKKLNKIFKECLDYITEFLKNECSKKESLSEATIYAIEFLKNIFSHTKYIKRYFEIYKVYWNSKQLIKLGYVEDILHTLKKLGASDIEIEFYGSSHNGTYLDTDSINYLFIDRKYRYNEETLLNVYGLRSKIIVFNFRQIANSYLKTAEICTDSCSLFRNLKCQNGKDIGLIEIRPKSRLRDELTVKEIKLLKGERPYKDPKILYLQQVVIDGTQRTEYLIVNERDLGIRHYYSLNAESVSPYFTYKELLEIKILLKKPIYIVSESEAELLHSYKRVEDKLREAFIIENEHSIEYKRIARGSLILKIFLKNGLDLEKFISNYINVTRQGILLDSIERISDPLQKEILKELVNGIRGYFDWKRQSGVREATFFRIALLQREIAIEDQELVNRCIKFLRSKSLAISILQSQDRKMLEYLPKFLKNESQSEI